jgi:hypothetical protein
LPDADPAPDWAAVPGDIVCPLCEYNLRGLTEPRCPECGYQFVWPDLLDPERRKHPWLFEENPRPNATSFVRTFAASFFPRRFWASLKPSHPPRPRRLVLYCLLVSSLIAAAGVPLLASQLLGAEWDVQSARKEYVQERLKDYKDQMRSWPATNWPRPNMASLQSWAAATYPSVLNWNGKHGLFLGHYGPFLAPTTKICLAWPFLTFATLMIFRASMRRAKVRPIHVLRCVIYGCNAAVWIGLLITGFSPLHGVDGSVEFAKRIALFSSVLALTNLYHLGCAFRRYLRFDHPWATIAASQIIVLMIFWIVAINLNPITH